MNDLDNSENKTEDTEDSKGAAISTRGNQY